MSNVNNILSHTDCLSQEQMQAYLENRLDKQAQHDVESHITDCAFCSDALDGLQMLPAEESSTHITEVKSEIENLLFAAQEKTIPEVPKLTVKRSGKRITLAAAAGLFLLIFAGGLVVFSYINNNTNWLNNSPSELAKTNEKQDEISDKESKSSNRELETFSLKEDDVNATETEIAKNNSPQKTILDKAPIKTRQDALARNTKSPPVSTPPLPTVATAPITEQPKKSKPKEIIAKTETATNEEMMQARQAGSQNTYSQPLYEGKLKDLNKEPVITKSSASKKSSPTPVREEADENADVAQREESRLQSTQYNNAKKKAITDNYTLGLNAFAQANYKESIRFLKRALRQKDLQNRDEANYYLAQAYEKTNEYAKAQKIYEELEKSEAYKKRAQSRLREMPVK